MRRFMFGRSTIRFGLLLTGLIVVAGCEIAYNGAWLMSPEEKKAERDYQQRSATASSNRRSRGGPQSRDPRS